MNMLARGDGIGFGWWERERERRGKRGWWIWLKKIWVVGRNQGHERSYLWTMHWISRVGGTTFLYLWTCGDYLTYSFALPCEFITSHVQFMHVSCICTPNCVIEQWIPNYSKKREKWITCIWPQNYYKSFFSNGGITLGWYWDHVILSMAH